MRSLKSSNYVLAVNMSSIVKGFLVFLVILLSIFSITGVLTSLKPEYRITSTSLNEAAKHISGKSLYTIFELENKVFASNSVRNDPRFSSIFFQVATNVRMKDPRSFLGRELPGFSVFDSDILVAGEGTDYTNMPIESVPPRESLNLDHEPDVQNTDTIKSTQIKEESKAPLSTGDKKSVFIYFTHTRESYLPYLKGTTDPDQAQSSKINVTKVGEALKSDLEDLGIGTEIDKTDVIGNLNKKGLDYWEAYDESRPLVQAAVATNKSLKYLIDVHRDSHRKDVTTTTINKKAYAKIAFVVGAEHPNYEQNLKIAKDLHDKLQQKYKGLSRGVFVKKGSGTNGKFNQDLSGSALLLEFGGVDNTFEELDRTAKAFADVFSEYYWQAEKVDSQVKVPASQQ